MSAGAAELRAPAAAGLAAEPQQPVGADVRQPTAEDRGHRGPRSRVDGRQPEVEREQAELDAERDEEADRDQDQRRVGVDVVHPLRRSAPCRACP